MVSAGISSLEDASFLASRNSSLQSQAHTPLLRDQQQSSQPNNRTVVTSLLESEYNKYETNYKSPHHNINVQIFYYLRLSAFLINFLFFVKGTGHFLLSRFRAFGWRYYGTLDFL